jgi:hypothetical protein
MAIRRALFRVSALAHTGRACRKNCSFTVPAILSTWMSTAQCCRSDTERLMTSLSKPLSVIQLVDKIASSAAQKSSRRASDNGERLNVPHYYGTDPNDGAFPD